MSFLFPSFLFGLFALAIPIIIHLFNFRKYKTVYFTNVRFLKELKQESESKSKIKHYLILLARLLAISALVLAFAQPFIPSTNKITKAGKKGISIYIDNSFSMEAISKSGYLLDVAKTKVRELVKSFGATDKFQLLTNDFEGKHQRMLSKEEFLQMLEDVKLSPSFKNISEVYLRQKDLLNQKEFGDKRVFMFSDFQKSFVVDENIKADTTINTVLVPLNANKGDNVFIDTCWFESPVQQNNTVQKLHVSIINKSSKTIDNAALKLFVNKKLITPASFSVEAGDKTEAVITYTIREAGVQSAYLQIEDHPVTYDDILYFSYFVKPNFPVLLVNGEPNNSGLYIRSLLKTDSLFRLTEMSEKAIDFSNFSKNNLIVLNEVKQISTGSAQELNKFVVNGGSLAIFPAPSSDLNSYNACLSLLGCNNFSGIDTTNQNCERINFEQGFFSDVFEKRQENVDLPKVLNHFSLNRSSRTTEEVIIKLMNGLPMLSMYTVGKGKVYLCTTSLDETWSNFSKHALFVPTIYKMTLNSQQAQALYFETGKNNVVEIKKNDFSKELNYTVVSEDKKNQFIPETRVYENKTLLYMQEMVKQAGNFSLKFGENEITALSFNYSRKESILEYFTLDEIKKMCSSGGLKGFNVLEPTEKGLNVALTDLEGGAKLWKLFIILTLLFVLIEIALIRFLK